MTRTSNLTKSHFVTRCVQLTGAPVEVGRGARPRKSLDDLGCLAPAFRHKDVRSAQTIRIEAPPCQQKRFSRKCHFFIQGVVTYMQKPLTNYSAPYEMLPEPTPAQRVGTPRSVRKNAVATFFKTSPAMLKRSMDQSTHVARRAR